MQLVQIFLVTCIVATTLAMPQNRPQVPEEAIDRALKDTRYLMRQLKCAVGEAPCDQVGRRLKKLRSTTSVGFEFLEAPCDQVGRRLKSLAPLVLRGACPQCSPGEVKQIQRVLGYVQKNYPREWNKILQQYAG
ncbi:Insect pheromone-binding family, A10/OS-D [Popillia japonica]|uniref:Insect pheromone-binding family, A10/OS-D n=1 Tax=Popillia japonica TaxID=7064 RepID=A0AAW1N2E8_POPJA